jgi:hypothetical protein
MADASRAGLAGRVSPGAAAYACGLVDRRLGPSPGLQAGVVLHRRLAAGASSCGGLGAAGS